MRKQLLLSVFFLLLLLSGSLPVRPASASVAPFAPGQAAEPGSPVVLCLPGIYLVTPGECAPAGPSGYLTEMAAKGMTFPLTPLPASSPDPALRDVNVRYGEVKTQNAPIYGSLQDATLKKRKNAVSTISGEFVYVSYTDMQEVGNGRYYMIGPNQWMTAADVSRIGVLPGFQGLVFSRTPQNSFGWILNYFSPGPVQPKRTPGYETDDYTGKELNLHDVVQIYDEQMVGDERWYLIGPDEWVSQRIVARVIPNTTPPEGVTGDRWIEVNLEEQTLSVYDHRQLVFATIIASGAEGFWTRPGSFQIREKFESTAMSGASKADRSDQYYLEDVPWTMYFDDARALHGAYWRAKLGFPQSHGCVNMTVGDSHWLFNWAQVGDWVYVWDPSGKTPTDPSLYTSGGY